MIDLKLQLKFKEIALSKLNPQEKDWLCGKLEVLQEVTNYSKFGTFFSLATRKISTEIPEFNEYELYSLNQIYPGFDKTQWTKVDLARTLLMMSLNPKYNQNIIRSFFEASEMNEQISLYKGLYLLDNAKDFTWLVEEGIRTNMTNVFHAIAAGNPFANTYLDEDAWNQLILKLFFMNEPLYKVQFVDDGKNEKLGNMLQEFVKERWSAHREVSPEIWRMIDGYLDKDLKSLIAQKTLDGLEKKAIDYILENRSKQTQEFWDTLGKSINK